MPWDKILLAAAAGGAVLFVWNAIVWMALQYHNRDFRKLDDSQGVSDALTKSGATPGFYNIPHYHEYAGGMKDPAFHERYKKGPNAFIVVGKPGPCMEGSAFVKGFVLTVLEGFAIAVLLHFSGGNVVGMPRTIGFCAALGAFSHGGAAIAQSIWMQFPWAHAWKTVFDGVVGYALAGLVVRMILG